MATIHISADPGAFATTVLLPGDPLRAEYIATHHLEDAREVTSVRNMLGFTGTHAGRPVSVMGTGMGIPSISIYATELIETYGVTDLVRVGSCGALQRSVALRDLVIAMTASTDSNVNRQRSSGIDFAAGADYGLLRAVADTAADQDRTVHVGNVFTSDLFYPPSLDYDLMTRMEALGVLAVEMEIAGLYGVAAQYGVRAVAVCTVSDHLHSDERLTADERVSSFDDMISMVLTAVA